MKKDMHYYGTFVMARAAGLDFESAKIVATSAQYVDDAAFKRNFSIQDGSLISAHATGHHLVDLKNLEDEDQRHVWVPFHFLPGCEGSTFSERLVCKKDSPIAKDMIDYYLINHEKSFSLELLGIAAHVYADTFSHYGFSGVSSRQNRVADGSIQVNIEDLDVGKGLMAKATEFFAKYEVSFPNFRRNFLGTTAELFSGALGHGAVATYPDLPYLEWSFAYEGGAGEQQRPNPVTFFECCEALHGMFLKFVNIAPQYKSNEGAVEFNVIKDVVDTVLKLVADGEGRVNAWNDAIKGDALSAIGKDGIPKYSIIPWNSTLQRYENAETAENINKEPVYRFFQAANFHRNYILRELLPSHGLIVI